MLLLKEKRLKKDLLQNGINRASGIRERPHTAKCLTSKGKAWGIFCSKKQQQKKASTDVIPGDQAPSQVESCIGQCCPRGLESWRDDTWVSVGESFLMAKVSHWGKVCGGEVPAWRLWETTEYNLESEAELYWRPQDAEDGRAMRIPTKKSCIQEVEPAKRKTSIAVRKTGKEKN